MPTYANDPVRINLTRSDILNLRHDKYVKKGICLNWEMDPYQKDIWFLQASGVSNHPADPSQEIQKEHIDKQLELLGNHIVQDRIRERYIDSIMPKDPTIKIEQRLDIKKFSKENRYDLLLDQLSEKHLVFNGYHFYPMATLEGHKVIKKEYK
jgi:hypothetical protein